MVPVQQPAETLSSASAARGKYVPPQMRGGSPKLGGEGGTSPHSQPATASQPSTQASSSAVPSAFANVPVGASDIPAAKAAAAGKGRKLLNRKVPTPTLKSEFGDSETDQGAVHSESTSPKSSLHLPRSISEGMAAKQANQQQNQQGGSQAAGNQQVNLEQGSNLLKIALEDLQGRSSNSYSDRHQGKGGGQAGQQAQAQAPAMRSGKQGDTGTVSNPAAATTTSASRTMMPPSSPSNPPKVDGTTLLQNIKQAQGQNQNQKGGDRTQLFTPAMYAAQQQSAAGSSAQTAQEQQQQFLNQQHMLGGQMQMMDPSMMNSQMMGMTNTQQHQQMMAAQMAAMNNPMMMAGMGGNMGMMPQQNYMMMGQPMMGQNMQNMMDVPDVHFGENLGFSLFPSESPAPMDRNFAQGQAGSMMMGPQVPQTNQAAASGTMPGMHSFAMDTSQKVFTPGGRTNAVESSASGIGTPTPAPLPPSLAPQFSAGGKEDSTPSTQTTAISETKNAWEEKKAQMLTRPVSSSPPTTTAAAAAAAPGAAQDAAPAKKGKRLMNKTVISKPVVTIPIKPLADESESPLVAPPTSDSPKSKTTSQSAQRQQLPGAGGGGETTNLPQEGDNSTNIIRRATSTSIKRSSVLQTPFEELPASRKSGVSGDKGDGAGGGDGAAQPAAKKELVINRLFGKRKLLGNKPLVGSSGEMRDSGLISTNLADPIPKLDFLSYKFGPIDSPNINLWSTKYMSGNIIIKETANWREREDRKDDKSEKKQKKKEKKEAKLPKEEKTQERRREMNPNSWLANHRETADGDEVVIRKMKGVLNKLTEAKFDKLYYEMIHCGIKTQKHIEVLMKEVFQKAVTQHHFIPLYTKLCERLNGWCQELKDVPDFRRILLTQCQVSFEANLKPPEGLLGADVNDEEAFEKEIKYKQSMLGNIKFVGELLGVRLLASRVLIQCAQELLGAKGTGGAANNFVSLECLAVLLQVTGKIFDNPEWKYHPSLLNCYADAEKLSINETIPPRIRYLLRDICDLRSKKWKTS